MKIVFSHAYFISEDSREREIMKPYPPLGILSVSAWLIKNGFPNEIVDSTFLVPEEWKEKIRRLKPEILAMYANMMTKVKLLDLIKWVKTEFKDCTVILGGPDVTHNIDDYLSGEADAVVVGEGEQTMLEIVQSISTQKGLDDISGIAFKDSLGNIHKTTAREKIKDLDTLPIPNREGINLDQYLQVWKDHHGYSAMSISTQRGCPYTCKWCSTAVYGQSYRRRSPQHVATEIKQIEEKYSPDKYWFVDDVFTINHRWIREFAIQLEKENLQISFECITRAERLNDEILDILQGMGCFRIWIGAESGSQKVLDLMDRRVEVGKVREMITATKKRNIEAGTFIMLGYPGESEYDIRETLHHLKESSPDHFTITVAYPIKGTALYDEVRDSIKKPGEWSMHTDRELQYDRAYSRSYYRYAIRWITNAVYLHQRRKKQGLFNLKNVKLVAKIFTSRLGMALTK